MISFEMLKQVQQDESRKYWVNALKQKSGTKLNLIPLYIFELGRRLLTPNSRLSITF